MTKQDISHIEAMARDALRVEALHDLGVLDSEPEQAFDDLAALASMICQAPIALVSLIDTDRQWFKARCGLDVRETSRDLAFCSHAIEQAGLFEVKDVALDSRFHDNALVTGEPYIRFYAGAPLVGAQGFRYGTLCVIDTQPRELTGQQREGLIRLARRTTDALETRRMKRSAEARESTLLQLLEAMPDGVVTCDAEGMLGEFNEAARDWHGVDPRSLPPEEWSSHFDLFRKDGHTPLPTAEIPLLRALRGEHVREAGIVIRAAGQRPRTVLCNGEPLHASDHMLLGAVCVMHDITASELIKDELKATATQLRTVTDNVPALVAHVGADLCFRFVNRAYAEWCGLAPEVVVGMHMSDVMRPGTFEDLTPRLERVLSGHVESFDLDVRTREGDLRHMHATYVPELRSEENESLVSSFHIMVHDETAQVRLARVLGQQALRDELTGLPNRTAWNEELGRAVARVQRSGMPLVVMFLDLDDFKKINDTYGHAAGDHVLKKFATVLRETLRASDLVARLAGDEVVVLLDRVTDADGDPPRISAKILARLVDGVDFRGQNLPVRPSIGIGIQRGPRYDAEILVRCADEAMYAAKRAQDRAPQVRECST